MSLLSILGRAAVSVLLLQLTPYAEAEETACAERAKVVERLSLQFGETLRSVGLRGSDGMLEVFASDATGSWTILITRPDGVTCLMAAGQYWETKTTPAVKPGKDA